MMVKRGLVFKILPHLILTAAWSLVVVYFHHQVRAVTVNPTIHTLIGFSLGMLLVFRTNASYDRFWEGRKLLGAISGATRNLIRNSEVFFHDIPFVRKMIHEDCLRFYRCLISFLRRESSEHPLSILTNISQVIESEKRRKNISNLDQAMLEGHLQKMTEAFGGCERILKTPLPEVYVLHLHRALVVYCYTLPFALLGSFHWEGMVIVGTVFLTFVLFGIEEIGVEIENPFGDDPNDLPLEKIYENLESTLTEITIKSSEDSVFSEMNY
ncbi:MAG: bestrophin family protein [Bacteriovoracaceae bacterium]